jgi:DnaJ family protein A protein 5
VEAATKLFAEVQSAYEVLSDPQERAWYDSHRDVFLASDGQPEGADYSYDTRMTTSDDILKLFSNFSHRVEFTDAPTGFYGALRETFARLAVEETMACRWENVECMAYPTFGNRDDDFEGVVRPFYASWSSFSTKKSFAWKDVHRYSEAPDRRVRRLMEKENRRLREEAIREFNEAVRSLVAFVKKRDPRYKSNAQSESQRQEVLRQTAAAQAARSRAANQAKFRDHVIQDWAKPEDLTQDASDMSEDEAEHFECVVCHKIFKSNNQFEAHERSKKHIKAVKQLRWEMREQDKELDLEGNTLNYEVEHQPGNSTQNIVFSMESVQIPDEQTRDDEAGSTTGSDKQASTDSTNDTNVEECPLQHTESSRRSKLDLNDADYLPREMVEQRLGCQSTFTNGEKEAEVIDKLSRQFSTTEIMDSWHTATPKMGKAKQKRAKKAECAKELFQNTKCTTCNTAFLSRTQLFAHIRELGHAQAQPAVHTRNKKGRQ